MMRPSSKRANAGLSVWNGLRPGMSGFSAAGSSEKEAPRFCQRMPVRGRKRPEPNAEKIDWMKEMARPPESMAPIQTVSPAGDAVTALPARLRSIRSASASSQDEARYGFRSSPNAGSVTCASRTRVRQPRRLDQAVDVLEAFAADDTEPIEKPENDERCDTLRGRRRIEQRRALDAERQRLAQPRFVVRQIGAGDRSAGFLEIGRDRHGDVAAVEIVEAGVGDLLQRVGKARPAGRQRRLPAAGPRGGIAPRSPERRRVPPFFRQALAPATG